MKSSDTLYKTGDRVPAAGVFETVTGRKMKYEDGQLFQACPETRKQIDWRHCDH